MSYKEKSGEVLGLESKINTGGLWRERRKALSDVQEDVVHPSTTSYDWLLQVEDPWSVALHFLH